MYGRLYKNIGLSLIIFAFFFLFEPNYGLIDPLPDFIGYIILCFSLINLADINEKIYSAFKMFRIGAIVGVVKILAIILVNVYFSADEQLISGAVVTFISLIVDCIVLICGFKLLYEGLLNLGIFEGGEAVHKKKRENGKNVTEKNYLFTVIFVIYKGLICSLPEFTSLHSNSQYEFVHLVRWFAIILVAPVSIAWLLKQIIYFTKIKRDRPFIDALSNKYVARAESNPEFYLCRVLFVGLGGIMAAVVLSLNIYLEDVNYLPNLFFFILLTAFAFFLRRFSSKWKLIFFISIPGVILSLLQFALERRFFDRHHIGAIMRDAEAYVMYYCLLAMYIIGALFTVAVIVAIALFIKDIFVDHGRFETANKDNIKGLNIRIAVFLSIGVVAAISNVGYIASMPYYSLSSFFIYTGMISFIFSIAFVIAAFVLYFYVIGEIRYKYKKYLI